MPATRVGGGRLAGKRLRLVMVEVRLSIEEAREVRARPLRAANVAEGQGQEPEGRGGQRVGDLVGAVLALAALGRLEVAALAHEPAPYMVQEPAVWARRP
jgi:hypothetical protein